MKKTIAIFLLIFAVKLVLQRLLIDPSYDLQRDEFLHLDQGRHLAWGYISVPPMTSWISWLIQAFGSGVFWVKFFPALFGTLTVVLVWKIIEQLNGGWFAQLLGTLAALFSVLLRINILYQPNSTDIFFWTLTYYSVINYVRTGKNRWLYATAIAIGLGLLSKYNIAFLIAGLFGGFLFTPQRKLFLNRHLYLAAAVALLLVLPNIIWQISHHFPTLHQLDELSRTQLVNVHRSDFLKDQLLFFINSFFILLVGLLGLLLYPPFHKYRFVLFSYLIALALYLFLKAKSYYAIGLYPVLLAFGSVYMEYLLTGGWKKSIRFVVVAAVVVLFIPMYVLAFPTKSPAEIKANNSLYKKLGLLRWEDGKDHDLPQDFADMTGWSDLAHKVDSVYTTLPDQQGTLVYCDNYGEAGAINYYSKFRNIGAVSFNADYINWFPLRRKINNLILVKDAYDSDTARTREKPLFDSVIFIGQNDNPFSREQGTRVFLLKHARADINALLAREIEQRKY